MPINNVADLLVATMEQAGIKRIFGIVGDRLNGFNEAVRSRGTIEWVHVRHEEVAAFAAAGEAQVMAWAYERPDKGRGFGFTGLHKHDNLADYNFRTLLLNAVAWVSKLKVPEKGVPSKTLTRDELEQLIDDGKLAVKKRGI